MNSIRLKITIHLNGNHALSAKQLNALKPLIERGIAASLPESIAVDTINVTMVSGKKILDKCPPSQVPASHVPRMVGGADLRGQVILVGNKLGPHNLQSIHVG